MLRSSFLSFSFFLLLLITGCALTQADDEDTCVSQGVLFADDFNDERRCGWAQYSRAGSTVAIAEGVLRLTAGQPGQIWWTNPGRNFDDAIITVQVHQVEGPNDNAFGVLCRYQSPENFYVFVISGDGYYAIGKYQSGSDQIQYLSGNGQYQASDAINQGAAVNELRVACIGDQLSLSVNGLSLITVSDPTFVTGDVGLGASTFQPGTTVIEFDNLQVTAP